MHSVGRDLPGAARTQRAGHAQGRRSTAGAASRRPPGGVQVAALLAARQNGMLARVLGHHVSPELFGLWCAEVLSGALLVYALLTAGLPDGPAALALRQQALGQAALLALGLGALSFLLGLYSPDLYLETRSLLVGSLFSGLLAMVVLWALGWAAGLAPVGRPGAGVPGLLQPLAVACWALFVLGLRLAFSHAMRADLFVRRLLVVGADAEDAATVRLTAALRALRRGVFQVAAVLTAAELAQLGPARLRGRRLWGVVVTDAARQVLQPEQLQGLPGRLYGDADFWEDRLRRIDIDRPAPPEPPPLPPLLRRLDAGVARLGDIVLSLALLGFTAPLMLLTALLIRLDSPGPVLYRQERVGLDGRCFTLLKFRSMRADAEARGPVWAAQHDPRVTRVGSFIRLTRIDELPQLINVLRGEMGFIGPRPERPHFVEQLTRIVPLYRERTRVKPGLTGWAQVNYPYGASVEDARAKLSYDLYYVKHRSPLLALLILFSTVWVVLFQKGAR